MGIVTTPLLSQYIASVTQASVLPTTHSAVLSPSSASGLPGTESPTLSLKSDNWSSGNGEMGEPSGVCCAFAVLLVYCFLTLSLSFWWLQEGGYNESSPGPIPVLSDLMVQRLSEKATELAEKLPAFEPKMVQNKKKISKDLLVIKIIVFLLKSRYYFQHYFDYRKCWRCHQRIPIAFLYFANMAPSMVDLTASGKRTSRLLYMRFPWTRLPLRSASIAQLFSPGETNFFLWQDKWYETLAILMLSLLVGGEDSCDFTSMKLLCN